MNDITELVKRAASGDRKAFDSLYERTKNGVWYTCVSLLKNEENAKDIMQDTYLTAFEKLNTLEEPAAIRRWLNKIAANKCKNYINSTANKASEENSEEILENIPDDKFLPEEYVTDTAKRRLIMNILKNSLSEEQYRTIILYYFDEMTAAEISALMDCHEKTVLYRLKTARLKIKEEVTRYEEKNRDKLHSLVPIAFLTQLLRLEAENISVPHLSVITKTPPDSLKVPSKSAAAAAKTGGKAMLNSLKAKIIAGVCAAAIVGGGVTAGVIIANNSGKRPAESGTPGFTAQKPTDTDSMAGTVNPAGSDSPAGTDGPTAVFSPSETFPDNRPIPVPGDYEYVEIEGGIKITKYTGSDQYLTVPSEIDGKPVLEMGHGEDGYFVFYEFDKSNDIIEINLSDGITSLGSSLFAYLPELKTVRLPDSVVSIGMDMFEDCPSLESVNLPEGERDFDYTFCECVSLTQITLPESAETLYETFCGCTSLESIFIPENVLIMERTFENCTSLKDVTFAGGSLTDIGIGTFINCTSLESIVIPDGVDEIYDDAFCGCADLKSITLPDTLQEIDDEAFMDCISLSEITLPDGVSYVSESAFQGCENIKITYRNKTYDYGHIDDFLADIAP
ncbi:MAG: sigma-70 family RNA polymerase sigma factor [Butyrivibrio sp.]|nr:sigma-70 family RNA polymerase sigma factor [Butyrivibrio sp.]